MAVYPVPEPDLTPAELIARATALVPRLRAEQDEAEERGSYTEGMHRAFQKAGFYRAVQPRMFGGYEFDIPTYYKAMLEICRGHPGAGWCLTLAAAHAFVVASHWSEAGQRDLFGPDGHFVAPHRPAPQGTATPAEGGYIVSGQWDYCSGVPHATHFIGGARVIDGAEPPTAINFVAPRSAVTVLDDWGGDKTLGMRASGSNAVRIERAFIPAHHTAPGFGLWLQGALSRDGTPGTRLHGNSMYLGQVMGPYHMGLVAPIIGAARAALDEYEALVLKRPTIFPPVTPRFQHGDYQRAYGQAATLADAAEGILLHAGEKYMENCRRWAVDGTPFTLEMSLRLWGMIQHAGQLAIRAVNIVFDASSSQATRKGSRIERYYRDIGMYRSHISSQYLNFAAPIGRAHFGLPLDFFGM